MRLHHVRERLLDQWIAVNQRAVEVEDQATRMSMGAAVEAGGGRVGSKKRFWFGCHVSSTSLGRLGALPRELRCRRIDPSQLDNASRTTSPSIVPLGNRRSICLRPNTRSVGFTMRSLDHAAAGP